MVLDSPDPAPSKRERNRSRQRDAIREAARSLFAERGFDPVSMADIAEKAGVARATVFNYFPSKHNLVEAMTIDVLGYYEGIVRHVLEDDSTSTPTLVRALLSHMGGGIEHSQTFYSGVFREILRIQIGLDGSAAARSARARALDQLTRLMERGQQRGELRREVRARDLAQAFDSLSNGTIVEWLYADTGESLRDRMERASFLFLAGAATDSDTATGETPELAPLPLTPTGPGDPLPPRRTS